MRTVLTLLLFGALVLDAQSATVKVHTIYVDDLHFPNNPDLDGLVRSKLISSLVQFCGSGCTVMEKVDKEGDVADAVLTGTMLVQTPDSSRYKVQGAMRLAWIRMVRSCGQILSTAVPSLEVPHPASLTILRRRLRHL